MFKNMMITEILLFMVLRLYDISMLQGRQQTLFNFLRGYQNTLYRIKGVVKIEELEDKTIFECLKCKNKLTVHQNYGKLHVVCKCGHSCDIYTGRNRHKTKKDTNEIPKALKVFDCSISDYQGRLVVRGKYENQSIFFLKQTVGAFTIGETENEILFFPSLHIEKPQSNTSIAIEPFECGEFCHYLSENEMASIDGLGLMDLKIKFIEFNKAEKNG